MVLDDIPNALGQQTGDFVANPVAAMSLINDPSALLIGVFLIILTIVLIVMIKKFIINTILGLVIWAITTYFFHVDLPFFASLIVSLVFGPAGVGTLLILRFLGAA